MLIACELCSNAFVVVHSNFCHSIGDLKFALCFLLVDSLLLVGWLFIVGWLVGYCWSVGWLAGCLLLVCGFGDRSLAVVTGADALQLLSLNW